MDLSRFTVTGHAAKTDSLKTQLGRLIALRWYYISSLVFVAAASSLVAGQSWDTISHYLLIGVVALAFNALFLLAKKLPLSYRGTVALLNLQLLLDLGVASFVTFDQGGLQARTSVLFALPIVAAGLLFAKGFVYITSILAGVGYVGSIIAYSWVNNLPLDYSNALLPLAFYPVFFIILGQLVVYLMKLNVNHTREKAYDAFLAFMMHQLKHPASTVGAIIDQLENGPTQSPEKNKKYLNMLKTENQNLLHLLNNLFETSLPPYEIHHPTAINLPALIQKSAHSVAENHNRNLDLKLKLKDMKLMVMGDNEKLRTVLINLLDNAFEYSSPGTSVTVTVHSADENVVAMIEDKGPGISKEVKRAIFQKYNVYESATRSSGGMGLGLYVAKKIITAHHGTLHIVSDHQGTRSIIILKKGNTNE